MINNTIAKRYAKALVQLGSEGAQIDSFREELAVIRGVFSTSAELRAVFTNPAITLVQKKGIMSGLIEKAKCTELVANFLLLLVEKNRVAFLDQIIQTYEKLADEQSGVIRPAIRTAFALSPDQIISIQQALEKKTGKKVVPNVTEDKTLLGGLVTLIGDIAFDSSVKTQLKRIQDILQKG
ncbi:MAG: ATP synthase F1 subunit delta [Deltaproteobacteria bacterium]